MVIDAKQAIDGGLAHLTSTLWIQLKHLQHHMERLQLARNLSYLTLRPTVIRTPIGGVIGFKQTLARQSAAELKFLREEDSMVGTETREELCKHSYVTWSGPGRSTQRQTCGTEQCLRHGFILVSLLNSSYSTIYSNIRHAEWLLVNQASA